MTKPKKKGTPSHAGPQAIGDVLGELMAQKGFARVQSSEALEKAWREAIGESAAPYTRPGTIRRGVLEVAVANSMLMQELMFQKKEVLLGLRRLLPDMKIQDLRFRVATIE